MSEPGSPRGSDPNPDLGTVFDPERRLLLDMQSRTDVLFAKATAAVVSANGIAATIAVSQDLRDVSLVPVAASCIMLLSILTVAGLYCRRTRTTRFNRLRAIQERINGTWMSPYSTQADELVDALKGSGDSLQFLIVLAAVVALLGWSGALVLDRLV